MSQILALGRGRLGRSLVGALRAAGLEADLLPAREWRGSLDRLVTSPEAIVILAVPDQFLAGMALELAQSTHLPPGLDFVHLSGGFGLAALAALREDGHAVGCLHPLQPFPTERGPEAFRGSVCSIDATTPALYHRLEGLVLSLGGRPMRLEDRWRPLYHAAAVMASTYVVVLADQATTMLQAAGWSRAEALQALLPLMRGTLDNLASAGLPEALNGPLRRADAETVGRHLDAIQSAPLSAAAEVAAIYRQLAVAARGLLTELGLSPEQQRALDQMLGRSPSPVEEGPIVESHSGRLGDPPRNGGT